MARRTRFDLHMGSMMATANGGRTSKRKVLGLLSWWFDVDQNALWGSDGRVECCVGRGKGILGVGRVARWVVCATGEELGLAARRRQDALAHADGNSAHRRPVFVVDGKRQRGSAPMHRARPFRVR